MIGAIENAMVARAVELSTGGALGYRLAQVDSYGGQFDEDSGEVARQFPLLFFAWSGEWAPPQQLGDNAWQYRPGFAGIVAARSLRNERATRQGAVSGDVGSYQILMDLRAMLVGSNLGLEILPITPGPARSLFNRRVHKEKLSVLVAEFRTEFVGDASGLIGGLDDFKTFHADWDIPPHEAHTSAPLADGTADATDVVTLETD